MTRNDQVRHIEVDAAPTRFARGWHCLGLAKDLADRHITVNAIAPGLFPSKMTKHLTSDDKVMGAIVSQVPLARMGEPQDIGGLAIFLSSVAGAYITGSVIPLGGGLEL